MKKTTVALAVMALVMTSAHAAEIYNKGGDKIDLYGKVKGEHDFTSSDNSDATYARIGFKGETEINESIVGFGQFEHNFTASKPEGGQSDVTRLAYAGLKFGDYGSIDYGRNYGIQYDIGSYADVLTEYGGDSFQNTDNYMTGRSTGLLTYRNSNFFGLVDGLDFGLQYQGANERKDEPLKSNGEGFGTSLQYTLAGTGVTVGAAYSRAKTSDSTYATYSPVSGDTAEAWSIGTKYDANSILMATTYTETHNMTPLQQKVDGVDHPVFTDKSKAFEIMAGYTFDFGLQPTIGYVEQKAEVAGKSFDAVKYVQLGAAYYFNKNFAVDVAYKINLLNSHTLGLDTDDGAVLGATYQF
ncbi:TPA: porin [Klebsiella quasipneumoniae subsp. quasipneumoniae]|nr:porin [Klebsiella quasipneumoniae subsp. quasipneumoniae]